MPTDRLSSDSSASAGLYFTGVRWTAGTGIVPLGNLPGGVDASTAAAIDHAGNYIAGQSNSGARR
jgi:hypothetical protein